MQLVVDSANMLFKLIYCELRTSHKLNRFQSGDYTTALRRAIARAVLNLAYLHLLPQLLSFGGVKLEILCGLCSCMA